MNEVDLDEYQEGFHYSFYSSEGKVVDISHTYTGGISLMDLEGPLDLFKTFIRAAGFGSEVKIFVNDEEIE